MKLKVYWGEKNIETLTPIPIGYDVDTFLMHCIKHGYIPSIFDITNVKIVIPWNKVNYIALVEK